MRKVDFTIHARLYDVFLIKTKVVPLRSFLKMYDLKIDIKAHILKKKTMGTLVLVDIYILKFEYNRIKLVFCRIPPTVVD